MVERRRSDEALQAKTARDTTSRHVHGGASAFAIGGEFELNGALVGLAAIHAELLEALAGRAADVQAD